MQFIQFIKRSGALGECKGKVRPVMAKRAFLILRGICRGGLREPPRRHRSILNVKLSVLFYVIVAYFIRCLKAENISSAFGHVPRKISTGHSLPYPLETWKDIP